MVGGVSVLVRLRLWTWTNSFKLVNWGRSAAVAAYRIPLFLAVLVNFAFLVRVPIARMWAEAAPPPGTDDRPGPSGPADRASAAEVSPFHAASQQIEITARGIRRTPLLAPPSPHPSAGMSRFAFTSAWGPTAQRLFTHWSAPSDRPPLPRPAVVLP